MKNRKMKIERKRNNIKKHKKRKNEGNLKQ